MPWNRVISALAGAAIAAGAYAQPASVDWGTLSFPATRTANGNLALSGQVDWYRFTLSTPVSMSGLTFLNVDSVGSAVDTEIGLYDSAGNLVATDDDDATDTLSAFSFGSGDATFAGVGGVVSNGRDGPLAPGVYYVAIARWNATFAATGWGVVGGTEAGAAYTLNLGAGSVTAATPPAGATDLGTLALPGLITRTAEPLAAGQIRWFRVVVPAVSNAAGTYLDIDDEGSALSPSNDPRIAVYAATGAMVTQDDNDGTSLWSQLSFGATTPARPAPGDGRDYDGRDGPLQAGVYYLGVGGPGTQPTTNSATAAVNFGFTSASTNSGTFNLRLASDSTNPSTTNPSGVGNANGCVATLAGGSLSMRVSVTPGTNPPSTGIAVTVNGQPLNLGTIPLLDDGINDDGVAGNNVFGKTVTVAPGVPAGITNVSFAVSDAQARSSVGSFFTVVVNDDYTGELPASASNASGVTEIAGTLPTDKVAMYLIDICDPASFSATTSNTGTTMDTQLFLFDSLGKGVTFNDEDPAGGHQSLITSARVTQPGTYYLAVSGYNRDPWTGAPCNNNYIWNNIPFNTERAPDGPGQNGVVMGWTGVTAPGTFRIVLTGVSCGCTITCDYNDDGGGDNADISDLADSIASGTDPYPRNCKDYNQDGGADNADVSDLADSIASGSCP